MRALVIVIFVVAALGAAGSLGPLADVLGLAASEASSPQSAPPAGTRSPEADGNEAESPRAKPGASAVEASADAGAAPEPASPSRFYQWVDANGSVHFAASLDEVPEDWRGRAGEVQLDSAAFTRTASTARKPARVRPIAEVAAPDRSHDVTVYTAPWCGWCRKTLAFLDERGIHYDNKDIESDRRYAEELREKTGGTAIPLVEIDGNPIRGFDPRAMTALLD